MSFSFKSTQRFERAVKKLKKRYPKITRDLIPAFESIESQPDIGDVIPRDYQIRKLRVASQDMKRGKSGGFRLLYKLSSDDDEIVSATLLFLYAKTDQSDVMTSFLASLQNEFEELDDQD